MIWGMDVQMRGPLLERGPAIVRQGVRGMVQAVIERGEERLNETLRPRPQGVFLSVAEAAPGRASTGHYRRSIHAEMRSDTQGRIDDSGVVYGPWLEGTGSRNQSTRFKGYASFRKTAQWLDREKIAILGPQIRRLVGNLS